MSRQQLRTIDSYLATLGVAEPDHSLAEDFHEATKQTPTLAACADRRIFLHLFDERAVLEASRNVKRWFGRPMTRLAEPAPLDVSLQESFVQRTSCRAFAAAELTLEQLAAVLQGLRATRTGQSTIHPDAIMHFRSYPSAGGLYPIEAYVAAPTPDRSKWTLAHYAPVEHALTRLGEVDACAFQHAFQDREGFVESIGAAIVFTGIFRRTMTKYGALGYRFALIEAGAMVQQIMLAASALGFGSLAWGGCYDDEVNAMLGIDGVDETFVAAVLIGKARDE